MMEMPPLPPLPPCDGYLDDYTAPSDPQAWTQKRMEDYARVYGESCARMAREEAAKVCDNVAANYTKHYELGARECAAAIRNGPWGKSQVSDAAYQQAQREENERMRDLLDSIPIRKG